MDRTGGMPSKKVALACKETIESRRNGEVFDARDLA